MSHYQLLVLFSDDALENEVLQLLHSSESETDPFFIQRATSPSNALELLAAHQFTLALLELPVSSTIGDGLNLILQMRQLKPILPIVALVNQDTLGIGIQALEFGASAYFSRSHLSAKTLQQIIKNIANQFGEVQDKFGHDLDLVDGMPIGVVVLDDAGVVTAVNDEWLSLKQETTDPLITGVSVGTNLASLCQTINRQDVGYLVQQATLGHTAKQGMEYQWKETAAPTPVWRKITIAPLRWPKGKVVVSVQEITELVSNQIQMATFEAEIMELKTNFSSLVHDLRSPLTAFTLYLDLLKVAQPEKKEHYFSIIHQEITHMNLLVDDLLTLSRLETSASYPFSLVNLANLIQEVVTVEKPLAEKKGLSLLFLPHDPASLWVWGQSRQLNRVITNLIGNSLRYTAVGHITIQLQVNSSQDQVEIIVTDTGIGIAPEVLPYIFEPFFRSPRAQAAAPKGTGLGLAIVKRIIALHNGSIGVSSELNQGTTIRVSLPLVNTAVP